MPQHYSIFTNNEWKSGSGPIFSSYNPATQDIIWEAESASAEDINEAVVNAKKAFKSWSRLSIDERTLFLTHFSEILEKDLASFAETISLETGKPLWESKNEIRAMITKIEISIKAYGIRCAGIMRDVNASRNITRHLPHGVIAVLGPFNFPGHLPHGHIVPALLAGNTIVFKPSELTPLVAEKMIQYWKESGLPKGVLNMVQGGPEIGQALAKHSQINGLYFTGSYKTGKWLSETFGSHPEKILVLELGGNNPLVIGKISDYEAAAYATIQSAYLTAGQRCTCARRLIVPQGRDGDEFIQNLIEMISRIVVGPYNAFPEPFMGPVIRESHALRMIDSQTFLAKNGGQKLVEMRHLKNGTGFLSPGLMDVTLVKNRPDEEIFGPFLQVIRVKNFEEAIDEANNTKFGLAAGLLSDLQEEYDIFYKEVHAGVLNWNNPLTGASSAAPFGGIRCSGNYRPSAYYAADYCAYPVSSTESPKVHIPLQKTPGIKER